MSQIDHWMPFYAGDYLADTMHLSRDEHGGYLLLIMAYWRNGGPLPDNDKQLAAIVKASLSEWRKLRRVLAPFFTITDDHSWRHRRIDRELAGRLDHHQRLSEAGAKGAERRWRGHSGDNGQAISLAYGDDMARPMARPMAMQWPIDGKPQPHTQSYPTSLRSVGYSSSLRSSECPPAAAKSLMRRARKVLGERSAGLVGKMLRQHSAGVVGEALNAVEAKAPIDPRAFFVAACEGPPEIEVPEPVKSYTGPRSPPPGLTTEEEKDAWWADREQRFGVKRHEVERLQDR